jgi:hypothetical protein
LADWKEAFREFADIQWSSSVNKMLQKISH